MNLIFNLNFFQMKTNSKCSLIIFSCMLVLLFVNLKSFAAEKNRLVQKNNSSSCLVIKDRYWLDVKNSSNQYYSQVLVAHLPNATFGYDDGLDGIYINDCQTVMSSIVENHELVINALPTFNNQMNVSFQFRNDVANTFTISLNAVQGIFNTNQPIFIQDQVTGITKT